MEKTLLAALAAALLAPSALAQDKPGQLGLGLNLGVPFGLSAKYILTDQFALDAALGAQGGNVDSHADFLVHFQDLWPAPRRGKLPAHAGLGLKLKGESDLFFGVRFVGGVDYLVESRPIELFAELAPILRMAPSVGTNFEGAAGVRFYFSPGR